MANRRGVWGFNLKGYNLTTKKDVLDLVQKTYDLATEYVTTTRLSGYRMDVDLPDIKTIRSGKQAENVIKELFKLDFSKIKTNQSGVITDIGIDTNLLNITRVSRYRTKTGKIFYYDSETFTAHEYSELIKQQKYTNMIREKYGLSTFTDIKFKRGTKFESAIHTIARAGEEEGITRRIEGDVQGVITSLTRAILDADNDYGGIDIALAQRLLIAISESGVIDAYAKIRYAMDLIGQNKFYDVYGSDKETIRDTGLMEALADAFDITFDISDVDTSQLDEEDIRILKDKSDRGELKYSDILILNGSDIKW